MATTLKNENIVCVALPSWEGDYMKSTVHLMTRLAESNRVLYVDYPSTWLDVARAAVGRGRAPLARIFRPSLRIIRPKGQEERDLHLLTLPPVLPINVLPHGKLYRFARRINGWLIARSIRKAMGRLSFSQPVVINAFMPGMGLELKGKLDEKSTIYYCYDEISEAKWVARHGAVEEKQFLEMADTVITTSDALWEAKERRANQCYVVKNGVDFPLFQRIGSLRALRLSQNQARKPKIGFVGSIDSRVDADLMAEVAQARPDWDFEFVGPVVDQAVGRRLGQVANITLSGPAKPSQLPERMKDFDAGIIPFQHNGFTKFIYPIKVNEYLAAGLPVVMTGFARIDELRGAVSIADDATSFTQALDRALMRDNESARKTRASFAALNSWGVRTVQFSRIVAQQLEMKRAA